MKLALYGMPCAGKTTIMSGLSGIRVLHGSKELQKLSGGSFSSLSEEGKKKVRVSYTDYVRSLNDEMIISDGHYSFLREVVFTEADGELYDVFLYLYCEPKVLLERFKLSEKNTKYASLSEEIIRQWQQFEIEMLRRECHIRQKDFYVISDNGSQCKIEKFLEAIKNGYSSYDVAMSIAEEIIRIFPEPSEIYIVDGDKTMIKQDSFRFCCNGKTSVFDGDFYSGYQSWLFSNESDISAFDKDRIKDITINELIWEAINGKSYVVMSSGISEIWSYIGAEKGMSNVIADTHISADTKYFVVKELQKRGYVVNAYGDSKIDIYMLKEAKTGTLYIGEKISRSLRNERIDGLQLLYSHNHFVLSESCDEEVEKDIRICKSNSGIHGNRLAVAHMKLGERLGAILKGRIPEQNAALLVLERGGRFFGDGVYGGFGGRLYPYNSSKDALPLIDEKIVVIIDSVINTGKSIEVIIDKLREHNPNVEIVLVTNVIQRKAVDRFKDYLMFAVRVSDNSFIGKNQATQKGNSGPDTADRLFNLIEKMF